MSGNVDVGEPIEITYTGAAGATVTATWLDPSFTAVEDAVAVPAKDGEPTQYPHTFLPTSPGVWTARFTASVTAADIEEFWVRARPITGPPPLATLGDVGERYGPMTAAQEGLARSLLRAASRMVRQRVPLIDSNIVEGQVDSEVAATAVVNMVLRVMWNPKGLRSETVGPLSRTFDTTAAAGQLVLTGDDLATLAPVGEDAGAPAAALGTIRMTAGLAPPRPPRRWPGGRIHL